jgi:hypothetical protein
MAQCGRPRNCLSVPAVRAGCMAALEAEWFLQGLETGASMDAGDEQHGPVEGRGAVQHDHHGPGSGRKTPEAADVAMAS